MPLVPGEAWSAFICDKSCGYSLTRTVCGPSPACGMDLVIRRHPMLCCRIAAGGLALLAASVVSAPAQSCLPWACQESRSSARATDATSTQNARNNLPSSRRDQRKLSAAQSQQGVARRDVDKMLDQEKKEAALKELRQEQRQENQRSTPADQAARDALFDDFLRWQVHQVIGE
jgi:hypothetical protein